MIKFCIFVLFFLSFKMIKKEVQLLISNSSTPNNVINDILVDFYLWNYRVDHARDIDNAEDAVPFHKIRCIFY
jgi:hypothetical protein